MKRKDKWRDSDTEKIYCYLCNDIIVKFDSPEDERRFSETGICSKCQRNIAKSMKTGEI
jgi:hypothetical protein